MNELKYNILIGKSQKQFADRGFEAILAIVLGLGTLALLMFFPVAGIAIAFFVAPFLCVGIKKYLLAVVRDKFLPIETIFGSYKLGIRAFCLKVATTLLSVLWGIVFIIPGIICMVNYSMAMFYLADDEKLSALECMAKSKKLVEGNRAEIFIIYLCYFLVTSIVLTIFGALGVAMHFYANVPVWVPIVAFGLAFLFVLIVLIIPYFELMLANAFNELVKAKTPKPRTNSSKTSKKSDFEAKN